MDDTKGSAGRLREVAGRFVRNAREAALVAAVFVLLISLGFVGGLTVLARPDPPNAVWHGAPVPASASTSAPSPTPSGPTVTLSATGDIIMGDAPDKLPPDGGTGMFAAVRPALAADLVMGNLEEPLTEETGFVKCKPEAKGCNQFRVPPEYAEHLTDAGFQVLNLANNHAYDYGATGYRNTREALEKHGLQHTGGRDQITVRKIRGMSVAVLGFSSYSYSNSLLNLERAKSVVAEAAGQVDLVVVQAHMGAEGADKAHVRPGIERFLGENRGDPMAFSHAVVDAGADLVVGHGPHILRGMEFYRGRLIAYSLGNFCGAGNTLSSTGNLGLSGVLKVSLGADGSWAGGSFTSTTYQGNGGLPRMDTGRRAAALVGSLSSADFPITGAKIGETGEISPPSG